MDDLNRFLSTQTPKLLTQVDAIVSRPTTGLQTLEFVYQVLVDWSNFTAGRMLDKPDRKERAFWYALYTLEDLAEFPEDPAADPFFKLVVSNLIRVTIAIKNKGDLPMEFFASRPGENAYSDSDSGLDEEFDWEMEDICCVALPDRGSSQ